MSPLGNLLEGPLRRSAGLQQTLNHVPCGTEIKCEGSRHTLKHDALSYAIRVKLGGIW